jgi:outer membrane protein assembly factor BamB
MNPSRFSSSPLQCLPPRAGRAHWLIAVFGLLAPALAQVNVLTQHNDDNRTGANLAETVLNCANVNPGQFGLLYRYPVEGCVYAQPLYVANVTIPGQGVHNVLYVVTMEDIVYAFDADRPLILWKVKFTRAKHITPVPITDITHRNDLNIHGDVGILSTPVIDLPRRILYLLARTKEDGVYVQKLHALDLGTGQETGGSPVIIQAAVPGEGAGSVGGTVNFDPLKQCQRPGLALTHGNVIIAWASHEDIGPYHGWVMAYDAQTLKQVAVFNTTPDGDDGGIWQSGQAPAIDADGNLYLMSGNGDWNGGRNLGCSLLKLSGDSLQVLDWFTPDGPNDNPAVMNAKDADMGSSGILLVPNTPIAMGGSKQGLLYLCDRGNLGHMVKDNPQIIQRVQAVALSRCTPHLHGSPIFWQSDRRGPMVYLWGENDFGRAFRLVDGKFELPAHVLTVARSPISGCGMPGGILSLSAHGGAAGTGVVWANCVYSGDALHDIAPGILRALDAEDLSHELWNSQMSPVDDLGFYAKYCPPTVANGKVYMATFSSSVNVYGLRPGPGT